MEGITVIPRTGAFGRRHRLSQGRRGNFSKGLGKRSVLAVAALLMVPVLASAREGTPSSYGLGTPADSADIAAIDIDILPSGHGLPPGSGDVTSGAAIYRATCAHCHGQDGTGGGAFPPLAGAAAATPAQMAADPRVKHTIGNYWGYATTLYDYVRRAMPYDRPGTLTDSQVYAVTAYLLHLNGLIPEDATLNAQTLPQVVMPARAFYRTAAGDNP